MIDHSIEAGDLSLNQVSTLISCNLLGTIKWWFIKGQGLCPVKIFTGHGKIWTRVQDPTCLVKTFTRHKLDPFARNLHQLGRNLTVQEDKKN